MALAGWTEPTVPNEPSSAFPSRPAPMPQDTALARASGQNVERGRLIATAPAVHAAAAPKAGFKLLCRLVVDRVRNNSMKGKASRRPMLHATTNSRQDYLFTF